MEKGTYKKSIVVLKKIAFIGPESTAKSSLCEQLALHYNTAWSPEYAREYISDLNRPYEMNDVLHCIRKQIDSNKNAESKSSKLFFADNEAINGMVWLLDKYQSCPKWVMDEIISNPFDLYLLTYPDIDFVSDNVRENGDRRMYFYDWYKKELDLRKLNYAIIRGHGNARYENALKAVENFLSENP
jgi:nicotinamide riboside kinase